MKVEFLPNCSPDCPLIRLFGYRAGEVTLLCAACKELAEGRRSDFALHEQPWVEAVEGCRFIWRSGPRDLGVRMPKIGEPFVLEFSDEAWREVEDKLLPFANGSEGFNWLTNEGDVAVLISRDGLW